MLPQFSLVLKKASEQQEAGPDKGSECRTHGDSEKQ